MTLIESLKESLAGTNQKSFIGLFISVLAYVAGGMTYLLPILVILMVIDYIVGIIASVITRKEFSLNKAFKGIIKKISYLLFIIFAQLIDAVVLSLSYTGILNVENFRYFGLIVNVYLIGTEGMSIVQNCADCGMPLPKPFTKFFSLLDKVTENTTKKSD